jgi:hypothetical protein
MYFVLSDCINFPGLIIKQMLTRAAESSCELENQLVKNTKGVVFYSTPHAGTQVAKLNATSRYPWDLLNPAPKTGCHWKTRQI